MPLSSADTERLRLERWDHAVHGGPFALVNAQPEVSEFVGGGGAMSRSESDELSLRISRHWDTYGFGLWAASRREVERPIPPRFTGKRVAVSAGRFPDGLPGPERRKTGRTRAEAAGDPGP